MSIIISEDETESKLIDLVKDNKLLYDKKVDLYRNVKKKSVIWDTIGSHLDLPGKEAQKLWTNLRSQFMAFRRKLKKPSGSSGGTRPFFRHERAMQFLQDSMEIDNTYSNVEEDDHEEHEESAEEESLTDDIVQATTSFVTDKDHRIHEHRGRVRNYLNNVIDKC